MNGGVYKAARGLLGVLLAVFLAVSFSCIDAPGSGPPAEWFPLTRELTVDDLNGLRATFTPALSGDYSIALSFRQPMQDTEVRDLVNRSASSVGMNDPVRFDFDWRILRAEKLVGSGTGRQGATGVIDTRSEGFGAGPLKSRALAFGKFTAEANRIYTIELQARPEFASVLRANPTLRSGLSRPRGTKSYLTDVTDVVAGGDQCNLNSCG